MPKNSHGLSLSLSQSSASTEDANKTSLSPRSPASPFRTGAKHTTSRREDNSGSTAGEKHTTTGPASPTYSSTPTISSPQLPPIDSVVSQSNYPNPKSAVFTGRGQPESTIRQIKDMSIQDSVEASSSSPLPGQKEKQGEWWPLSASYLLT